MNEELKIIIKAVTDEAKKNIAVVKKELEGVEDQSKGTGKSLDAAMKGIAKGVTVAIGSVIALTAAMTKLGHTAQDINKGFGRLKSSFENAGSGAKEATKYYKELFGVLGDHDRTVETGQSLARITTNPEALSEYKNIMAGAVSQYGDGYNTEALSENISETIAAAQVTGDLERVLVEAGISADAFNNALAQATSIEERELLIRNTLNGVLGNAGRAYIQANQATILYNESQANLNITLAQAASYTTPFLTSINTLGASLLTLLAPALQTVAVYLTAFIQLMVDAIQWVGGFFGMFGSSAEKTTANVSGYRAAMSNYLNSLRTNFGGTNEELDKNLNKINAVKKATMGFDELNVVSTQSSASVGSIGGGGGAPAALGSLPVAPNPEDYGIGGSGFDFSNLTKDIEEAKEKIQGILVLVGLVGGAFLLWKIAGFTQSVWEAWKAFKSLGVSAKAFNEMGKAGFLTTDGAKAAYSLGQQLKLIGGYILIIAGALLLVKGYTDAWVDGVDWGNMALMISGAALACTGLYLAFGKLALTIGAVVAAAALMVIGVKDFIENGPTLQNTILIIGGAIAAAVALATAGVSVLLSAIIAAVAAIGAFVAAILLEKPAIMSVEEAQKNLTAAKEAAAEAEMGYVNAIDAAEASMERLKNAEEAAGITGEELYKQVQSGTLDYANMTDAQKEVYKAYLDNEKKQKELEESTKALNEAKKAETLASYENQLALAKESGNYDEFKKSVVDAFEKGELSAEEARDLIGKSMSEMGDDAQQTFMKDLPNSIKDGLNPSQYETARKKIADWFKQAWKDIKGWVKQALKDIGGWFKQAWKDIKGFFSDAGTWFAGVGKKVGEALSGAFKKVINWVLEKIEATVNAPFKMINKGIDILNKVPGISITKLGLISIPRLATGGIVTSSTLANIGEAGKEAVLPLENNTGWMDILADRIASRQSAPTKVALVLDGKELGYATINSINNITKQTGSLQLSLA